MNRKNLIGEKQLFFAITDKFKKLSGKAIILLCALMCATTMSVNAQTPTTPWTGAGTSDGNRFVIDVANPPTATTPGVTVQGATISRAGFFSYNTTSRVLTINVDCDGKYYRVIGESDGGADSIRNIIVGPGSLAVTLNVNIEFFETVSIAGRLGIDTEGPNNNAALAIQ
ncbi:MAG: hypothetical protein LBP96_03090, partial [Bacteroidales bacterium]|nr:hypothetical protein [Bacteroidales bacterium]